jgi:hypothetical protein
LWARPGAYPGEEHLKVSSIGYDPALPTNIRLGWKGWPVTKTLAYYEHLYIMAVKSFITFGPGLILSENCKSKKVFYRKIRK